MRKIFIVAAAIVGLGILTAPVDAQNCYRMTCDQSQRCKGEAVGSSGKCCCKVECVGGPGGVSCTCTTWCEHACGSLCPSCDLCVDRVAATAGEEAFSLTPETNARIGERHLLAAQVLTNLSGDGLTQPIFSGVAEGKSNVDFSYDYSYKVRIRAMWDKVVMDFVFSHPEAYPAPTHQRVTVDQLGNVDVVALSPEDAEQVRSEAAAACSAVVSTNSQGE